MEIKTWKEEFGWEPLFDPEVLNLWFGLLFICLGLVGLTVVIYLVKIGKMPVIRPFRIMLIPTGEFVDKSSLSFYLSLMLLLIMLVFLPIWMGLVLLFFK